MEKEWNEAIVIPLGITRLSFSNTFSILQEFSIILKENPTPIVL